MVIFNSYVKLPEGITYYYNSYESRRYQYPVRCDRNQYPLIWLIVFDLLVTYIPACMRTSIYTSIHTYMYITYIYVHRRTSTYIDVHLRTSTYIYVHVHLRISTYIYVHTCIHPSMYMHPSIYVNASIHPSRQTRQDRTGQDKTRQDKTRPDQTDRQTDRHAHYRVSTWYLL